MRTVCELVLNESYYLHPSITSLFDTEGEIVGKNALSATSASFEAACSKVNTDLARTVFRIDCIATTKVDEWSNMFHVHGLASVLSTTIVSVYPKVNQRTRQLFHCHVPPRISDRDQRDSIPLIMMWTHLSDIPRENMQWSPNHFVPCFTCEKNTAFQVQVKKPCALLPSPRDGATFTDSLTAEGQPALSQSPKGESPSSSSLTAPNPEGPPTLSHSPRDGATCTFTGSLTAVGRPSLSHLPKGESPSSSSLTAPNPERPPTLSHSPRDGATFTGSLTAEGRPALSHSPKGESPSSSSLTAPNPKGPPTLSHSPRDGATCTFTGSLTAVGRPSLSHSPKGESPSSSSLTAPNPERPPTLSHSPRDGATFTGSLTAEGRPALSHSPKGESPSSSSLTAPNPEGPPTLSHSPRDGATFTGSLTAEGRPALSHSPKGESHSSSSLTAPNAKGESSSSSFPSPSQKVMSLPTKKLFNIIHTGKYKVLKQGGRKRHSSLASTRSTSLFAAYVKSNENNVTRHQQSGLIQRLLWRQQVMK